MSVRIGEDNLLAHLERAGQLRGGSEHARVEVAGEGNINFVRRVRFGDGRSVIVKHAGPTLERFPQYSAPVERLVFEYRYVIRASEFVPPAELLPPRILHFDPELPLLVLEDLGSGPDLGAALASSELPLGGLNQLGRFLAQVHLCSSRQVADLAASFENTQMQQLHGEHIFTLPYEPDAFPLEPAVRASADRALGRSVRERIQTLRALYYESRQALVHADVQTSNLLLRDGRLRLLDAEISHVGDPAFDLGTALAHVHVHTAVAPERTDLGAAVDALLLGYAKGGGSASTIARAHGYAGVEMLRRTLGAARFAAAADGAAACRIVDRGAALIRDARL